MEVDDAELLALAGGDSSDEENPQQASSIAKAVSPLPSIEISRADAEKPMTSMNKAGRIAGGRKAAKKTRQDDSEEEGEA